MQKENIFQDTKHLNVNPPEWTNSLREDALKLLQQNSKSGILKSVQYDINPENQALEMYQIVLSNDTVTTAFIAYRNDAENTDYIVTIHLSPKNFNNEQHSK